MVAYSFKGRFEAPLIAGVKRTTIRNVGKKRHARPGERMTFTTGDRFHPRLIGEAVCTRCGPVEIDFDQEMVRYTSLDPAEPEDWINLSGREHLDIFARIDGFVDWPDLVIFWRATHGEIAVFEGLRIGFRDFKAVP